MLILELPTTQKHSSTTTAMITTNTLNFLFYLAKLSGTGLA
jgi:hypothetical protein